MSVLIVGGDYCTKGISKQISHRLLHGHLHPSHHVVASLTLLRNPFPVACQASRAVRRGSFLLLLRELIKPWSKTLSIDVV
jgi:hypothetical protein